MKRPANTNPTSGNYENESLSGNEKKELKKKN